MKYLYLHMINSFLMCSNIVDYSTSFERRIDWKLTIIRNEENAS